MNERFLATLPDLMTVVNDHGQAVEKCRGQVTTVNGAQISYDRTSKGATVRIQTAIPVSFVKLGRL
ncbi:hypothetical protein [Limosilactobacillus sp.]|uniref:hypothetical protein n=1 Tax=Limosilactobacillus sp. TaxID=2773925 RepID=UPI003F005D54